MSDALARRTAKVKFNAQCPRIQPRGGYVPAIEGAARRHCNAVIRRRKSTMRQQLKHIVVISNSNFGSPVVDCYD